MILRSAFAFLFFLWQLLIVCESWKPLTKCISPLLTSRERCFFCWLWILHFDMQEIMENSSPWMEKLEVIITLTMLWRDLSSFGPTYVLNQQVQQTSVTHSYKLSTCDESWSFQNILQGRKKSQADCFKGLGAFLKSQYYVMGNNLVGSFDIAVCGVTLGIFLTTAFMCKGFNSFCGGEKRNQRGKNLLTSVVVGMFKSCIVASRPSQLVLVH